MDNLPTYCTLKAAPSYCVTKAFHFHSAHRNTAIMGKCQNVHGHTYHVDVEVSAPKNAGSGVTILFEDVEKWLNFIKSDLDHCLLLAKDDELIEVFRTYNQTAKHPTRVVVLPMEQTSAENLAKYIAERMISHDWKVTKVTLRETTSSAIIYKP